MQTIQNPRVVLTGFFSTFGDLEVLDVVCRELRRLGINPTVAPYWRHISSALPGTQTLDQIDSSKATHLFIVCGPFWRRFFEERRIALDRFDHCVKVGINLSMIEPISDYQPFDILIERDQTNCQARIDLALLAESSDRPVVGMCLAADQSEYSGQQDRERARALLSSAAQGVSAVTVTMDTTFPQQNNAVGIGSAAEFIALCSRLDAMLTDRLHGLVLSLRAGTPVLAVDGIIGGGKVSAQAMALGWPECHRVDLATQESVDASLRRVLAPTARDLARERVAAARSSHDERQALREGIAEALSQTASNSWFCLEPDGAVASFTKRALRSLSTRIGGS